MYTFVESRVMALIMVADDNAEIVDLLKDYLESRGHQVVTVGDGMAAAEKAQTWKPQLILCDIQMPNVYGTTTYSILRRNPETKDTPIIFITGVPLEAAQKIVPQEPKVRLLCKPVDLKVLDRHIEEMLAPPAG